MKLKTMRYCHLSLVLATVLFFSCKKDKNESVPHPQPNLPVLLIKDVKVSNLPSPYYYFEYDTSGKVSFASFASGFFVYDISYNGDRISEMQNITAGSKDRLQYMYDNAGRVSEIKYVDEQDILFERSSFFYEGQKLIKVVREKEMAGIMVVEKTSTMSYHADGNLFELTEHRPAIPIFGQPELTYTDRFGQYDDKINTDAFRLVHPDFFEHLVLLPGVRLQKNNPGKVIRTGEGVNYEINYNYTYDGKGQPLTKMGEGIILNGTTAGQRFQVNSIFTYY